MRTLVLTLVVASGLLGCQIEGGGAGLDVGATAADGSVVALEDGAGADSGGSADGSSAGDAGFQHDDAVGSDAGGRVSTFGLDGTQGDSTQGDSTSLADASDDAAVGADAGGSDGDTDTAAGVDAPAASTPTDPPTSGGLADVELGGATMSGMGWLAWTDTLPQVTAIFGPQGSHHVWVSVCVPKWVGATVKARLTLKLQGSQTMVYPGLTVLTTGLKPIAGHPGQLCRLALPGFVKCACTLAGQVLRVRVEILSKNKLKGWAERSVQLVVPAKSPCPSKGTLACSMQLGPP